MKLLSGSWIISTCSLLLGYLKTIAERPDSVHLLGDYRLQSFSEHFDNEPVMKSLASYPSTSGTAAQRADGLKRQ